MFQAKRKRLRNFNDEELIIEFQRTDEKMCVSIIYERYSHLVFGTSLKYVKDRFIAEDITMQVFESLFTKLKSSQITYFKSWLYIVTKNECLMYLRRQQKPVPHDLVNIPGDTNEEGEKEQLEQKLTNLEEQLPLLKEGQRQCIELFYLKGMSYQQVSDALNMPIKQVKSEIQNGKRNLKILMTNENEFNS